MAGRHGGNDGRNWHGGPELTFFDPGKQNIYFYVFDPQESESVKIFCKFLAEKG